MLYSIVIPCYNSSATIREVVELTAAELNRLGKSNYEFVLVNDASPDEGKTIAVLRELVNDYKFVKVVDLAKNSGQHNAVRAGLNYADGDVIIGMDDDMQTHPSQLKTLFDEFEKGHDIVYGYYPQKKHTGLRNLASKLNYWSVRVLIGKPKELKTSSFWIIKKFVRDYIVEYKISYPYLQGMFIQVTKDITCVPIEHFERKVGTSNYTFKKLISLWSGILGFSITPLRLALSLGYIFAFIGILSAIVIFVMKIFSPNMMVGWPSMMCAICFFSGLILFFIGLVGEYIGRMFLTVSNSPQFVVREVLKQDEKDK